MRIALPLAAALLACASAGTPRQGVPAAEDGGLAGRCARGLAGACRDLGRAELAREAEVRDERLAAALLAEACEQGDPAGCGDLGVLYAIGCGVAQSDARATALSRRACEQGAALACSNQGTLLAEGVSPGGAAADRDARAQRLFRTACDAGAPEGCANLGAVLEGGRGGPRDLRAAARAEKRACDAGLALSCHRLALLVAERPDTAPDVTVTALEARACRAAIAPACAAVSERTPAPTARTPTSRLVDDRSALALGIPGTGGFSPGELAPARGRGASLLSPEEARRPPEALVAKVPAALRSPLGLDLAPRRKMADDPAVERLLALRRFQLGQCHEAPRAPGAPATEVYAVLFVDRDGRPVDVAAATSPAEPTIDACVAELVRGWEFPASHGDLAGPYLVRAAFVAAPAGGAPAYAGPGSLKPALRDPRCVERGLRVPAEYRGATGSVTVKLAVDAAGTPGLVHALTPAAEPILDAVEAAVLRCPFKGGADAAGRPATLWLTLTVNLSAR